MSRTRCFLLALVCGLFAAIPAFAQFQASIQGTVTDPSGAVVPNARVAVTNQATGVSTTTQTTGAGVYRASELPPGMYTVDVKAPTFQEHTSKDVRVSAEQPTGLNIQLTPGQESQSVTVTAENAGALQTENANVAGNLTTQQVVNLPQFGRDPYELLRLAPGVFGDGSRTATGSGSFLPNAVGAGSSNNSIYQVENQPQIVANGQRVTENNFMIDGVDVNSLTNGGAAVVTPTQESVSEIHVLSSSYEAEDGRNSGAQVKVISKTGTNNLHGSGFFKYDEPGLNAFNQFGGFSGNFVRDPKANQRVDNAVRNFGGSIGGPIVKNKLFFFFAYEGEHRFDQNFGINYIETPQFIQEVTAANPNSIAAKILGAPGTAPRINAVLTPSCADVNAPAADCQVVAGGLDLGSPFPAGSGPGNPYLSLGNQGVGGAFIGGGLDGIPDIMLVQEKFPNPGTGNQYNGRVDWNINDRHTLAFSTYLTNASSTSPPGTDQTSAANRDVINKPFSPAGTVLWNWIISPTTLNEVRLNFSRFAYNEVSTNPLANFGIPDDEIQDILKNGRRIWFGVPQGSNTPGILAQNTYGFGDNLSKTLSKHALKFGFQYRKEQSNNNEIGFARPLYTFSHLWNFANDAPIFEQNAVDPRSGNPDPALRHFRTDYYGGFAQDDWKVMPTLTLNVGLRYEYYTPVSETNGLLSNLLLAGSGPLAIANGTLVTGKTVYSTSKNNFAPRFGFAWSPAMYDQKTVIRGGFGVYYDPIYEATFDPARENPPFHALEDNCCGTDTTPFDKGLILYTLGASNSPLSYPGNPLLGGGIGPNNFPINGGTQQVYFEPQHVQLPQVYGYSLEVQTELPRELVMTLGYQGSDSHHLVRIFDANQVFDAPAGTTVQSNPSFYIKPDVTANYNSLNVDLRRNFSHGFQADAKYRWSKSLDEVSFGQPDSSVNETFPRDLKSEYGPSDFDTTNFFIASGVWDLPILRGNHDLLGKVLGGWQLTGIYTYHSGFPWTPVSNNCLQTPGQQFICPIRPVAYFSGAGTSSSTSTFLTPGGNFPAVASGPNGFKTYFDPGANCTSVPCVPGVGRNSFRGPLYHSLDLTFGKNIPLPFLGEHGNLQLRLNAFNVTNHLNLAPFRFNTDSTIIQSPFFGTSGTTPALAGRVLELQARFDF